MNVIHPRRAWALVLMGLVSLWGPFVTRAAPPDRLKSLTVSVWLDYDRPGALYMYAGELPDGAGLPASITFRLPQGSGGPSATAGVDASGKYRYIRPVLAEEGDRIAVTYDINWPRFQLEYYIDDLVRQGQRREFELVYKADYAIDQLVLEIKEPYRASDLALDPAATSQSRDGEGQMVHRRIVGPVERGQEVRWKASYVQSDTRLVSEALGLPTPSTSQYEAGPGITPPRQWDDTALLVIVVMVAIAAFGGLAFWARSQSARTNAAARRPRVGDALRSPRSPRKRRSVKEPAQARRLAYCYRCGTPLEEEDRFCRRCGAPRRDD